MASIFKRGGRANRYGRYYIAYTDERGRRKIECAGTADFEAARQIAGKIEAGVALRGRGVVSQDELRFAEHNQRALADHVQDYLDHCEHVGQDRLHVANKKAQLKLLLAGTGATRLSDLEPNRVEGHLRTLTAAGKSARTHNQHRCTAVSFMQWCFTSGRVASNPLKIVPTLQESLDQRRVRRAMTDVELSKLLAVEEVKASGRGLYYLLAAQSGLRVKAARAATWGDIDLDGGLIRVKVGNAKAKREQWFNLHPQLWAALRTARPATAKATDRVFPTVPRVPTFHRDCVRAGVPRYDEEGRQLDRHALRTYLGTSCARAGLTPQMTAKIMGVGDVKIVMRHYTKLRLSDQRGAVDSLPQIVLPTDEPAVEAQAVELRATGTDGPVGSAQRQAQRACGFPGHSGSLDGTSGRLRIGPCDAAQVVYNTSLGTVRRGTAKADTQVCKTRAISSVG